MQKKPAHRKRMSSGRKGLIHRHSTIVPKECFDLSALQQAVVEGWPADTDNYPDLAKLSDTGKIAFMLRHVHLHQSKALGDLATCLETYDHGNGLDLANARDALCKMVANALRFADVINLDGELMARHIFAMYPKK